MGDEYDRRKRLIMKSPARIRRRNEEKRSGLLHFEVSEDGTTVRVWNYRKLRSAEKVALMIIASSKGALYDTKSGGLLAKFAIGKPEVALGMLKLTPVPEACARCEGTGQIQNPIPAPQRPTHDWMNETREEFEVRRAAARVEYDAKHGNGAYDIVECPICRGTGRAVQLESEET